jgi:hypothetical protein
MQKSTSTVLCGDVRKVLQDFPDEFFHMGVTSSPYYGLRAYGTEPQVWGGDPNCQHDWGEVHPPGYRESDTKPGPLQHEGNKNRENLTSMICSMCGAWKGELGLEPTPEMFVLHLVEIAREFRRTLRDDGTLWWNLGDSYAATGKSGGGKQGKDWEDHGAQTIGPKGGKWSPAPTGFKPKDLMEIPSMFSAAMRAPVLKCSGCGHVAHRMEWGRFPNGRLICPKCNLSKGYIIHEEGWYLRSRIPWVKRNCLPSSVKDRPGSSIDYVFLFSKSPKYYYDYIATMQKSSESYDKDKRPRGVIRQCVNPESKYPDAGQFKKRTVEELVNDLLAAGEKAVDEALEAASPQKQDLCGNPTLVGFNARYRAKQKEFEGKTIACDAQDNSRRALMNIKAAREESGSHDQPFGALRYMRDSDFFFKTWQGLLHNENGEPMALVVNPKGYKGAHFACFPVRLPEAMILAGTSEAGVCPECGAPWVRDIKKNSTTAHDGQTDCTYEKGTTAARLALLRQAARERGEEYSTSFETLGWHPTCSHHDLEPVPATVADFFAGSCATGVACQWHNRDFIGIELNHDYCNLGRNRLKENK